MELFTLDILQLGFRLAGEVLGLRPGTFESAPDPSAERAAICHFLTHSAERIEAALLAAAAQIINKIETDKLEELVSRTRNLALLVSLQKPDQVLQYAMTLRESVDYAHNRISENKPDWYGPYLSGYAIYIAALQSCGACPASEYEQFRSTVQKAKLHFLDISATCLFQRKVSLPWFEIADFLSDEGAILPNSILSVLAPISADSFALPQKAAKIIKQDSDHLRRIAQETLRNSACYIAPAIPKPKLDNANLKLIPKADPQDELIALIDLTIFGIGAAGVAFFPQYLIYADNFSDATRHSFADLAAAECRVKGSQVFLGDNKFELYQDERAEQFAQFLQRLWQG